MTPDAPSRVKDGSSPFFFQMLCVFYPMLSVTFYSTSRILGLGSVTPRENSAKLGESAKLPLLHFIAASARRDRLHTDRQDRRTYRLQSHDTRVPTAWCSRWRSVDALATVQLCGVFRVEIPKDLRAKPSLGSGQSRPTNNGASLCPFLKLGEKASRARKPGSPQ